MRNAGIGWAYPFHFDDGGGVARVGGEPDTLPTRAEERAAVSDGVQQIVLTRRGERVMVAQFGLGLHALLFSPLQAQATGFISAGIVEQLGWWEPRVELSDVLVGTQQEDGRLEIAVQLDYPGGEQA